MSGQVGSRSLKLKPKNVWHCLSSCKSPLIWWQPDQTVCKDFPLYLVQLCALNPPQSASAKCLGITSRPWFGVHSSVMWKGITVVPLSIFGLRAFSAELIRQSYILPLVVSLSPPSPVYPVPFGVRRTGGWASRGRARHPPLPRPRHQGRILTKDGFLNGPTI